MPILVLVLFYLLFYLVQQKKIVINEQLREYFQYVTFSKIQRNNEKSQKEITSVAFYLATNIIIIIITELHSNI